MSNNDQKEKGATVAGRSTSPLTQRRTLILVIVLVVIAAGVWIGLAASGGSSPSTTVLSARALGCQQVGDALSDGPDPDVDPVGHAEAQIKPLDAISTSDSSLQSAIDELSAAYAAFYKDNGSAASASRLKSATATINTICPGAAS